MVWEICTQTTPSLELVRDVNEGWKNNQDVQEQIKNDMKNAVLVTR